MRRRTTKTIVAAATLCALLTVGDCSSKNSSAETTASAASANASYKVVPDTEVAKGLGEVTAIMGTLQARRVADETDARAGLDEMYTKWFEFEGTIRKNEKDLYLQMEDGLVSVKIGVQENRIPKIVTGVADFETARAAYLAKHP